MVSPGAPWQGQKRIPATELNYGRKYHAKASLVKLLLWVHIYETFRLKKTKNHQQADYYSPFL
jgi:hypothetical protein